MDLDKEKAARIVVAVRDLQKALQKQNEVTTLIIDKANALKNLTGFTAANAQKALEDAWHILGQFVISNDVKLDD